MLDTSLQHMVKGNMHFPVYHYDTHPHKATGYKGNDICEIVSSLKIIFGIESGLKAEFKQLCIPAVPVFYSFYLHLLQQKQGPTYYLSIPLGGFFGNQTAHLIDLFTLKPTPPTHTQSEVLLMVQVFLFVCFPCSLR